MATDDERSTDGAAPTATATATDLEGRHVAGDDPNWHEVWEVDLATSDGSFGVLLRLTAWPVRRITWCWAAVVGVGRPLVTVVEHEAPLLRGPGLDLRAEGLWTDQICETPLEHWTVGLEAFGVALEDPVDAFTGCRGDRTALGLDVEWESDASKVEWVEGGYELPCEVNGEILVGHEALAVEAAWGRRRHTWGVAAPPAGRAWGRSGGRRWSAPADVVLDERGLVRAAEVHIGTAPVTVVAAHHAPVQLPAGGRVVRALGTSTAADGRTGAAWVETTVAARQGRSRRSVGGGPVPRTGPGV